MENAYFTGLRLGLGLIVAIGAQNAFVLRQGLRREHVFWVAAFCAGADALLIGLGVWGFALAAELLPWLGPLLRWGGVCFLAVYGARALRAAWRGAGEGLRPAEDARRPLGAVLSVLALLTFANPHVWLDTVVMLGSISAQFPGQGGAFAAGAITGSVAFFFALAYGARALAPLFARPAAWRVLDAVVGLVMWWIAATLALGS